MKLLGLEESETSSTNAKRNTLVRDKKGDANRLTVPLDSQVFILFYFIYLFILFITQISNITHEIYSLYLRKIRLL